MYVYKRSEFSPYCLYTVGYYDPNGKWISESDHETDKEAANRTSFLNGNPNPSVLEENERLKRMLESLTPSGSEFVNDPEYCVKFVKEQIAGIPKIILPFKRRNDELEQKIKIYEETLGIIIEYTSCFESDREKCLEHIRKLANIAFKATKAPNNEQIINKGTDVSNFENHSEWQKEVRKDREIE